MDHITPSAVVGLDEAEGPRADVLLDLPAERRAEGRFLAAAFGVLLGLDTEGKVIANLQDGSAGNYSPITTAREYGDWLYLGSLKNTSMARLPLKLALAQ